MTYKTLQGFAPATLPAWYLQSVTVLASRHRLLKSSITPSYETIHAFI